ncbi:MAG: OmpA family protein [Bacteroidia bacterium]|nr:OmpA family protein [Bacteroidia bacterium]
MNWNSLYKSILLLIFSFSLGVIQAQTAGKYFKEGKEAANAGKSEEAIVLFTKAIELKPNDTELKVVRAQQYVKIKQYSKALKDYNDAIALGEKDKNILIQAVDVNIELNNNFEALVILKKLLEDDKWFIPALERKSWCQIKIKTFEAALTTAEFALERNQYNYKLHYCKAIAKDSLGDFQTAATEYQRAITILKGIKPNDVKPLPEFKPYFRNLAIAQHKLALYDDAIKNFTTATTLDALDSIEPKNYRLFYERSFSYFKKNDFTNAVGDLNKAIVMNDKDKDALYQRGVVYQTTSQFQSAISDFTKCIQLDEKNSTAFSNRGKCYLELSNYKESISDFKKAFAITKSKVDETLLLDAKQKQYNANKESDAPEIKIAYPVIDMAGFANVFDHQKNIVVEGQIKDKSQIEYLKINGVVAKFNEEENNPEFRCNVPLTDDVRKLEVSVSDIYHNTSSKTIKVGRIINDTKVKVTFAGKILSDDDAKTPFPNKEVYLVNEKGEIFFVSKTDAYGRFKFENLPYDQPYFLTMDVSDTQLAKKTNFIIADENNTRILVSTADGENKFRFSILPSDYNAMALMTLDDSPLFIDIKGKLMAANDSKTPLSNMTVLLINGKGEAIASKKTDAFGVFLFSKLIPKENYTIQTDSAESQAIVYNKILVTDENGKIIRELTKNPQGYFKYELLQSEKVQLSKISAVDPWLKALTLSKDKKEMMIIENIYYQSGSWEIMPEAEVVLTKAIDALKANSKLTIEVQSHTDAVAGDDYNMELSQKRASTAVDYMVSKGIDKKRLSAKGFGESQLTNKCVNGVECSDAEHKQNRRTVFKINYSGN